MADNRLAEAKADPSQPSFLDLPVEIASNIARQCRVKTRHSLSLTSKTLYLFDAHLGYNIHQIRISSATLRNFDGGHVPGIRIDIFLLNPRDSVTYHFFNFDGFTDVTKHFTSVPGQNYLTIALKIYQRFVHNSIITRIDFSYCSHFVDKIPNIYCEKTTILMNQLVHLEKLFEKLENKHIQYLDITLLTDTLITRKYPEIINAVCLTLSARITSEVFMSLTSRWVIIEKTCVDTDMLRAFRWSNGEGSNDFLYLVAAGYDIDLDRVTKDINKMKFTSEMYQFISGEDFFRMDKFFQADICFQVFSNVNSDSATLGIYQGKVCFAVTGKLIDMDFQLAHPIIPVEY
ncbi:unnamed protein product [Caenorhabditis bovis]|uniref:Uncharacterized protein n=1 Tax=Caenorhabditis bovis TaxID=2654633 RepID=A0A8S1FDN9_9PELO|nr:unnamed protein product [Caenorhabditis bovis]